MHAARRLAVGAGGNRRLITGRCHQQLAIANGNACAVAVANRAIAAGRRTKIARAQIWERLRDSGRAEQQPRKGAHRSHIWPPDFWYSGLHAAFS